MYTEKEYTWNIVEKREETPDVYSLILSAAKETPAFKAGQYLTVKLPGIGPSEGKAYSISNAPSARHVRITVKKAGTFSQTLIAHKKGGTLVTSAPYGFFYPESEDRADIVFIAGGIGIAPCMSIATHLTESDDQRNMHFLYSNKTQNDIVFEEELQKLADQNEHISITHFITRENTLSESTVHGRINKEHISKYIPEMKKADYFICGSIDFTRSMWKELNQSGVSQFQIYTEGFY